MQKAVIAICLTVFSVSACVNRNTVLTNSKGEQVHCEAHGWGWFGAPMASNYHSRCLENTEAQGYAIGTASANALSLPVGNQTAQIVPTKKSVGEGWSRRKAKREYKADEISRSEYEAILVDLTKIYKARIRQTKIDYQQGLLSKGQYKQELLNARYDYEG